MTSLLSRDRIRPASSIALFAAVLLALLALLPAPAEAHDTLISSDPADGATLEASPEAITLTFSADILDVGPIVRISDESGEVLAEVTPQVDGPTATAALEDPLPAGTHTVQWRVVSSDGHPIEGTFTITVEEGVEGEAAASDAGGAEASDGGGAAASDAGGAGASDAGSAASDADDQGSTAAPAEDSEGEESGSSMPLLLGIVGVAVVGVAIAAVIAMRRRS